MPQMIDTEYLDYLLMAGLDPSKIIEETGLKPKSVAKNLRRRGNRSDAKRFDSLEPNKWRN